MARYCYPGIMVLPSFGLVPSVFANEKLCECLVLMAFMLQSTGQEPYLGKEQINFVCFSYSNVSEILNPDVCCFLNYPYEIYLLSEIT